MSDPEPYLKVGIEAFRRKAYLPKNLGKASWVGMSDKDVRSRLWDEFRELEREVADPRASWTAILDKAADVLAFASMGADPARLKAEANRRYGRFAEADFNARGS